MSDSDSDGADAEAKPASMAGNSGGGKGLIGMGGGKGLLVKRTVRIPSSNPLVSIQARFPRIWEINQCQHNSPGQCLP